MDEIFLYVSTDIKGIRKGNGSFIWLLETQMPEGPLTLSEKERIENETGRIAELTAMIRALGRINKRCTLSIRCTSKTLAKDISERLETWAANDFEGSKGEPIKDADKWREFYSLLSQHKLMSVSSEHNSYSSWLQNELGWKEAPGFEEPETRISSSYDTILEINRLMESLDLSEVSESDELANAVKKLCETFFVKFKISATHMTSGFVRLENAQSQKSSSYSGNVKITSGDKSRAESKSNS